MRPRGARRRPAAWLALALLAAAGSAGGACTKTYTRADLDRERARPEDAVPACSPGDTEEGCVYQDPACLDDPDLCGPPAH